MRMSVKSFANFKKVRTVMDLNVGCFEAGPSYISGKPAAQLLRKIRLPDFPPKHTLNAAASCVSLNLLFHFLLTCLQSL